MGFLDKLLGRNTPAGTAGPSAPAAARATAAAAPLLGGGKAPTGPLNLQKGDFVTHYRDRFAVVGHRILEGDGGTVLHYCLRDKNGAAAVLACEGAEPSFTLQRAVKADVKWDADQLTGIAEEPLRVVKRGRMKVRTFDDAGVAGNARSVEFRRYADTSGDVVLCLDDYEGRREVRLGEPVYEAEMEFERGSGGAKAGSKTAVLSRAKAFEDADDEVVKGTPRAAAKALEQNMGTKSAAAKGAAADHDPTAYDDDKWIDAVDEQPAAKPRLAPVAATASDAADDEDDEWTSASQLVRQQGAIVDDDDPGPPQ